MMASAKTPINTGKGKGEQGGWGELQFKTKDLVEQATSE
jgi:hypothetical protein